MLLETFAVHCTFFGAEYLPAISFLCILDFGNGRLRCQVEEEKAWDGVLEAIHYPRCGWWNVDALVALLLRLRRAALGAPQCSIRVWGLLNASVI